MSEWHVYVVVVSFFSFSLFQSRQNRFKFSTFFCLLVFRAVVPLVHVSSIDWSFWQTSTEFFMSSFFFLSNHSYCSYRYYNIHQAPLRNISFITKTSPRDFNAVENFWCVYVMRFRYLSFHFGQIESTVDFYFLLFFQKEWTTFWDCLPVSC